MARRAIVTPAVEAPPQADHLENVLHPRANGLLIGQEAAANELASSFASGRMHHGWLLQGPEGIGKATLAYRLARHVFANGGGNAGAVGDNLFGDAPDDPLPVDMDAVSARQVTALSHPGLLVLRRQWDTKRKKFQSSISVDEVRRVRSFLGLSSGDGGWRVVIVDRADEMNTNAANALLKSLEEPPQRCIFLLVASEPGRLPVTIHSRCRQLTLTPLGVEDLQIATEHVVAASDVAWPEDVDWQTLHRLSQGSVRRAIVLAGEDGLALYSELMEILALLPKVDRPRVHGHAESLALIAQETRFNLFLDLLQDALARMIRVAALGEGGATVDGDPRELQIAQRIMTGGTLAQWSELWDTLARDRAEARLLNLDRQSLILGFFQRIETLARTAV